MLVGSVVPMVVEQDGRWERSFDIYSRLLRERIVFLGQEVNDDIANLIAAQLLHLDAQEPGRDIYLYVNSPGGSAYAGMAIYDAMQYVQSDVSTVCLGMGMSAAAMILSGGAPGKRFALPNAKIMIHQGSAGYRGTPADIQIAAREILSMTRRMAEIISRHTNQDVEQVMKDIDRDRFMTPGRGGRVRHRRRDHGEPHRRQRQQRHRALGAAGRPRRPARARDDALDRLPERARDFAVAVLEALERRGRLRPPRAHPATPFEVRARARPCGGLPAARTIASFEIRSASVGCCPRGASRSCTTTYGIWHALQTSANSGMFPLPAQSTIAIASWSAS